MGELFEYEVLNSQKKTGPLSFKNKGEFFLSNDLLYFI